MNKRDIVKRVAVFFRHVACWGDARLKTKRRECHPPPHPQKRRRKASPSATKTRYAAGGIAGWNDGAIENCDGSEGGVFSYKNNAGELFAPGEGMYADVS